jgi:hypothetical protein
LSSVRDSLSQLETIPSTKEKDFENLRDGLREGYEEETPTQRAGRESVHEDIQLLMALRRADALKSLERAAEFLNERLGLKGEAAITASKTPDGAETKQ